MSAQHVMMLTCTTITRSCVPHVAYAHVHLPPASDPAPALRPASRPSQMSVIGIDVGSETSVIAEAKRGGVDIVLNENSNRKTPTMVSFQKNRFMGEQATPLLMQNFKNTVGNVKGFIGRAFADPEMQALAEFSPVTYTEGADKTVHVQVEYNEETRTFSGAQVFGMVLQKLKATVKQASDEGVVVRDVVLSVPGFFNQMQRNAVLDAIEIAGLNCLRLINECTAVALSYGIWKSARNQFR